MQSTRQGELFQWESYPWPGIYSPDGIEFVAEASGDPAGQQSCTGRAAIWCGDIRLRASHPRIRNRNDVRRGELRIALAPQLAITQIIGQQDQKIRLPGSGIGHVVYGL